jgi:SAM-dependent methyltransferase
MLFWYGAKLGIQALFKGRVTREVLKNIIVPVNYWRNLEFRIVLDELQPKTSDRILDIGSPKLLSLYLADKVGAEIFSTDVENYFINDYKVFGEFKGIEPGRFHVQTADARHLNFSNEYFSKVYSISVVEHIPDTGDIDAMKEIARILSPKGVCVLTVPFAPESRDEYKNASEFYWAGNSKQKEDTSGRVFFQRRYSERDLQERLIKPSGLELIKLRFLGEKIYISDEKELAHFLPPITGFIHPLLSTLFHYAPANSWQALRKPCGALIVLQKP